MSHRNTTGTHAGLVFFIALKAIVIIARVAPDVTRALPPPRFADEITITRPIVEAIQMAPEVVGALGDGENDE